VRAPPIRWSFWRRPWSESVVRALGSGCETHRQFSVCGWHAKLSLWSRPKLPGTLWLSSPRGWWSQTSSSCCASSRLDKRKPETTITSYDLTIELWFNNRIGDFCHTLLYTVQQMQRFCQFVQQINFCSEYSRQHHWHRYTGFSSTHVRCTCTAAHV